MQLFGTILVQIVVNLQLEGAIFILNILDIRDAFYVEPLALS